ncbi:MAG: bifunctional pyr operon transcriptional regulator/uracil phosphoribosyltransferase PyrR [Clostridia bacterium]
MSEKNLEVMDKTAMDRALNRIAHEIIEHNDGTDNLAIIGIKRRGVPMARRLASIIEKTENVSLPIGVLDISFYRDDLQNAEFPATNSTYVPFSVSGLRVVLTDDVLYTGRTIRAAMDALIDMGRPNVIELAVMIDRGHRELPISANYIGKKVPTSRSERVSVKFFETDGINEVVIN